MDVAREIADHFPIIIQHPSPLYLLARFSHGSTQDVTGVDKRVVSRGPHGVLFYPLILIQKMPLRSNVGIPNRTSDEFANDVLMGAGLNLREHLF
jgi:hypothetical protein